MSNLGSPRPFGSQSTRRSVRQRPTVAGRHTHAHRRARPQWHASLRHQPVSASVQRVRVEDPGALLRNRFDQTACHRRLEASRGHVGRRAEDRALQTRDTVYLRLGNTRSSPHRRHLQSREHPECTSIARPSARSSAAFSLSSRFRSRPSTAS